MQESKALDKWDGRTDFTKTFFANDPEYHFRSMTKMKARVSELETENKLLKEKVKELKEENESLIEELAGEDI